MCFRRKTSERELTRDQVIDESFPLCSQIDKLLVEVAIHDLALRAVWSGSGAKPILVNFLCVFFCF